LFNTVRTEEAWVCQVYLAFSNALRVLYFYIYVFVVKVKDMCLRFAAMEAMHGEAERARALYVYASTYCDPRTATVFWKTWQDFEVEHGNEETFREMLRIKRSVATSFSSANYAVEDLLQQAAEGGFSSTSHPNIKTTAPSHNIAATESDDSATLAPLVGSKRSATQAQLPSIRAIPVSSEISKRTVIANPDEIDLDDDVAVVEDGAGDIEQKQVPTAVFGGLSEAVPQAGAAKGALDRFRSRQR
jgi:pre-mRNA-splicing factor SYF1